MIMRKMFLLLIVAALGASAADLWFGTWKINLEKSEFSNPAAWKGRMMIIESAGGDAYRTVFITPTAKIQRAEEIRYLDGKEHPGSTNPAEMTISRRIDDRHHTVVLKRDGKEIASFDSTVSADGKTLTNLFKGVDANGKAVQERRVYDRQ
jgi:hypothetical protein